MAPTDGKELLFVSEWLLFPPLALHPPPPPTKPLSRLQWTQSVSLVYHWTRAPQRIQYFKLVFLEILNVTNWSILKNQVTHYYLKQMVKNLY